MEHPQASWGADEGGRDVETLVAHDSRGRLKSSRYSVAHRPTWLQALQSTSEFAGLPVNWRWHRAVVGKAKPGDVHLAEAIRYVNRCGKCQNEDDFQRVIERFPHLHAARMISESPDRWRRGLLEARILANQPPDAIAKACKLDLEVIHAYERVFFDIRSRLHQFAFVLTEVIGEKCWHGLTEEDSDIVAKRLGFSKGPLMVDRVERYYSASWEVPASLEGMAKGQLSELAEMLRMRALIWAMTLPPSHIEHVPEILKLNALASELAALAAAMPIEPSESRPSVSLAGPVEAVSPSPQADGIEVSEAVA